MTIIANPIAGRGDGREYLNQIKGLAQERGVNLEVLVTRYPGHAGELAQRVAAEGTQILIVLGGDGTISEVVNGIAGSDVTIGIISVGTGNDFARSLQLPVRNPRKAWEVIQTGITTQLDLGECDGKYFISSYGVGFPVEAIKATSRIVFFKGSIAFFLGVLKALWRMQSVRVQIEIDESSIETDCAFVLVQNTPYLGGGLRVAPRALLDDGLLDVVVVEALGRLDVLANLPRVYRGRHEKHPRFSAFKAKKVIISSREKLQTMCDGELGGYTPSSIRVHSNALQVIVGSRNGDQRVS
ncbi:MAG TPA: diacylglycerol kinase family protein [Acidobacteriota bacterium]|nr:diacylglycerol kinase family protein [Acidobacteriota bacterium]